MTREGRSKPVHRVNGADSETQTVLHIARRVSATVGGDYFAAIVRHLAGALAADCILIGEFVGGQVERVKTRAAFLDGELQNFDYDLAESAAAQVAVNKTLLCRSDARTRFPNDTLFQQVKVEACVGLPLPDKATRPAGILAALYRQPLTSLRIARSVLEIFAERTSAELTREREAERLRESDQRYRAFIAQNIDGMWRIEFEQPIPVNLPEEEQVRRIYQFGYLAECNDALARLRGLEFAEQMIGWRMADLAPLSEQTFRDAMLQAVRSGYRQSAVETSPIDAEGKQRYMLRSQWGIVEDGELKRVWGSSRDITALKHTEQARDASEQRMVDLLETVHLAVVIVNLDDEVAFCNKYLYTLTGWEPATTLGKDWIELMVPGDERSSVRAVLAGRMEPESTVHFECALLGPNGSRREFAWDCALLRDFEGKAVALANVGRDITEQRTLTAQLQEADKLASVGRLAGGVAHDFNNLLTVIMGYSGAVLEDLPPSDPHYYSWGEVHRAAVKGADLTRGLLAFSRRQVLRPSVVNLNVLIRDIQGLLSRLIGEPIEMRMELEENLGFTRVDAGQFSQVLMNLVVNARDAMPQGGTLTIRTASSGSQPEAASGASRRGDRFVEMSVSDTGSGMSDEVRSHIFEPFYTTKEHGKGTGLGLSTAYGIVHQSGGHIDVETALGHGTTFRILLPEVEAPARLDTTAPVVGTASGGTETILVVEDQDDVRELMVRILTGLGYTVLEASGAEQALRLSLDMKRAIDLLITDIVMPGLGGPELADKVKLVRGQIRVLFISGYTNGADVNDRLSQPGFGYLAKPFAPDKLARAVRHLLD